MVVSMQLHVSLKGVMEFYRAPPPAGLAANGRPSGQAPVCLLGQSNTHDLIKGFDQQGGEDGCGNTGPQWCENPASTSAFIMLIKTTL